ncbi:MAG: hypothetical protein ACOCXZ_01715 [Chloroflexota bacterium]
MLRRFAGFLTVLMLVLLVAPVAAQDEVAPEDVGFSGVIAITLVEGSTLEAVEDGYVLTVVSPVDFAPSFISSEGSFQTFNYPLFDLQSDWVTADTLEGLAVLDLGDVRLEMTISAPTFDIANGTLSYFVTDLADVEIDKSGDVVLPEVESGSLMIQMDAAFVNSIANARITRLSATRSFESGSGSGWSWGGGNR